MENKFLRSAIETYPIKYFECRPTIQRFLATKQFENMAGVEQGNFHIKREIYRGS